MRRYVDLEKRGRILERSIAISGRSATGKSTLLKQMREHYMGEPAVQVRSAGQLFREIAPTLGMDIDTFVEHAKTSEINYDLMCDLDQQARGRQDNMIREGHIVCLFSPFSFNVLVTCPLDIRAARRQAQGQYPGKTLEEIARAIEKRDSDDDERYLKLYGTLCWDEIDFDFVLRTNEVPRVEMRPVVLAAHRRWIADNLDRRRHRSPIL